MSQLFEVERERGCRQIESFCNRTDRGPFGSCLDEVPEDRQTAFLGQGGKSSKCTLYFHVSSIIEMINHVKADPKRT